MSLLAFSTNLYTQQTDRQIAVTECLSVIISINCFVSIPYITHMQPSSTPAMFAFVCQRDVNDTYTSDDINIEI
jgi:hypothetical protein